jgi:hypothetical protein
MSPDPNDEPKTYFQWQQSRRAGPGEGKASDTIAELPPLPTSSPWGDPIGPGDEPTINREEDGLFINQEEDASHDED